MSPPILIVESSSPVKLKSRNGIGYPTTIETSLPAISELSGNWKMDSRSTKINMNPNIAPSLFVGISSFGKDLPMILLNFSLPMYWYFILLIGGTLFCISRVSNLALNNFAEAD